MANIAQFFINRPVFATAINIVIGVLGFVCLFKVPIREYPNIERKIINVSMEYAGASVEVVESQIAYRFEEALSSVPGLQNMSTKITPGMCDIQLAFGVDDNIDTSANEVESRLRRIRADLPENLREPTIVKVDPNAQASFSLALLGPGYNSSELSDKMTRYVKSQLESIPGVASVIIPGQSGTSMTYAIDVHMRPDDMAALKITPEDLFRALSTQSFVQPAGDVILGDKTYRMTVKAGLNTVEDFGKVIVKEKLGRIIRVSDVADVKLGDDDKKQRIRYNGQVVSLCYVKVQPSANLIQIAKSIKKKIPEINKSLPDKNLKLEIVVDKSEYINSALYRLLRTILEAVLLVGLVVLFFLKSFRTSIIPLVTIPVCLLSGFFIMYLLGFTINVITLLAMLLAVGLVVDDSIVLIERFSENIDHGMNPIEACVKGMSEIQVAVAGMTLTLISVYLPISLLSSTWGKFFNEFALSLAGMVLVSGLVAFVLTPTMSASLLGKSTRTYMPIEVFNSFFESIKSRYYLLLKEALRFGNLVILASIALFAASLFIAKNFINQVSEPESDKGHIYLDLYAYRSGLSTVAPVIELLESLKEDPKYKNIIKSIITSFYSGSDKIDIQFVLKGDTRTRKSCTQIVNELKQRLGSELSDYMPSYYFPSSPLTESNRFGVTIKTSRGYDELEDIGSELSGILGALPSPYQTSNVQVSRTRPEKTFNAVPNRDRAYLLGVRLEDIRNAIKWITRGNPPADRYEKDGRQYPVRLWVSEDERRNIDVVKQFYVRSSTKRNEVRDDWELISLRDLVDIEETKTRPLLQHEDSARAFYLYSEFINKDVDMLSAYQSFEKRANKVLPPGYTISPSRNIAKMLEERNNILIMMALALVFVYLVMAAQFESFLDPFIVMCTVPLATSWALLSLWLFPDGSLNPYSYIGILTLIGLITKHGILLVDFFNKKLELGKSLNKAATEAALERFRPIIMTTLAMVLGALPLILSKGSGYEGPKQVGIVIVGGLTFGTIMTIFVVPCLCVFFKRLTLRKSIN